MIVPFGTRVVDSTGKGVGTVSRVVLHRDTREVAGLVVHQGVLNRRGICVPIGKVASFGDEVRLTLQARRRPRSGRWRRRWQEVVRPVRGSVRIGRGGAGRADGPDESAREPKPEAHQPGQHDLVAVGPLCAQPAEGAGGWGAPAPRAFWYARLTSSSTTPRIRNERMRYAVRTAERSTRNTLTAVSPNSASAP